MASQGTFKATNYRYLTSQILDAGAGAQSLLGGVTTQMLGGGPLKLGDLVQVTATAFQVNTGTQNAWLVCGVVVGGDVTNNEILTDNTLVASMTVCSTQGASVIVQRSGVVQIGSDGSNILVGSLLGNSTVIAGRAALVSTTATVSFGLIGYSNTATSVATVPLVVTLKGLI